MEGIRENCLILGGSSDIGVELTKKLLDIKLNPILTYSSKDGFTKINNKFGRGIDCIKLDLSVLDSIYKFFSNLKIHISYFVDLAHTNLECLFASTKDIEISNYYNANVINRAIFLKHMVRNMLIKRRGRLIYISSTAAMLPFKGQALYSSSKLAIESIYRSIGIEMYKKGISTTILRLGYVQSGRSEEFLKDKRDKLFEYILNPEDIANSIVFFLKDNGKCFNARDIILDRGLFASKMFF